MLKIMSNDLDKMIKEAKEARTEVELQERNLNAVNRYNFLLQCIGKYIVENTEDTNGNTTYST